jgi:pyruvate,water dikinase
MSKADVYFFPGAGDATLGEVGGKGLSLIEGARSGLPVPPGFVLTVRFFAPWLSELKDSHLWEKFLVAKEKEIEHACRELKHAAAHFHLTAEQKEILESALQKFDADELFAVRSSSPHEDLEGASFAGGYETILGESRKTVENAIQQCFQSLFDYRVIVYMRANCFDATDLKIPVVLQKQVASDISGVGLSLNPVTNNFDEAVFNANWGLGETVVSGVITPDTFIVDKVSGIVRDSTVGGKAFSIWLNFHGGTDKKENFRSNEKTLSDVQLIELTQLVKKVESIYGKPMDIEWAFEKKHSLPLAGTSYHHVRAASIRHDDRTRRKEAPVFRRHRYRTRHERAALENGHFPFRAPFKSRRARAFLARLERRHQQIPAVDKRR